MSLVRRLEAMDAALGAKGFPRMSPWWRETLVRFYSSGRRQLVVRVGRRGGKSSTLCRLAVLEALFGEHVIPPGDVGVVAFISTRREEAGERLRTIRAILDALRVPYALADQTIELRDRPIAFRVFVASVAGVVGFTSIAVICDEVARWRDSDSGANPAREVLASLRPTMATQRNAKIILSSSPLGTQDAHARAIDDGDTRHQVTATAPTWIANPTITEQQTRDDEPDPRIWAREYAAVPQAGELAAFDLDAVARAFEARPAKTKGERCLFIDASSGRKDAWTWAIAGWSTDAAGEFFEVDHVDGLSGSFWRQVSGEEVVSRLVTVAKTWGASVVHGDQREAFMLEAAFRERGLAFTSTAWTQSNKVAAVETLRRWFRDRSIAIIEHERMRRELAAFEEKITPSGSLTFAGRGSGDDYVALLITAAMVDAGGALQRPGEDNSPAGGGSRAWAVGGSHFDRANFRPNP
ncbi:MAG: hypothetical protein IPM79_31585 [Polyangiaceae bacterium]|nr:hypothetical protein [Polyangiaceae bacterium]